MIQKSFQRVSISFIKLDTSFGNAFHTQDMHRTMDY